MKRIGILLCCIVLCLLFPEKVHAEEIVTNGPEYGTGICGYSTG